MGLLFNPLLGVRGKNLRVKRVTYFFIGDVNVVNFDLYTYVFDNIGPLFHLPDFAVQGAGLRFERYAAENR